MKQLMLDLPDAVLPADTPHILADLKEAQRNLAALAEADRRQNYRDAHTYALKLRYTAECLAKELETYIY